MSISTVITDGFGSFGDVAHVIALGLDVGSTPTPTPAPTKAGGDDAFHGGGYHPGWNKKKWLKDRESNDKISETLRRIYYGIPEDDPEKEIEIPVSKKTPTKIVRPYSPVTLPKFEKFDINSHQMQFNISLAAYKKAIDDMNEHDDEEALLMLL